MKSPVFLVTAALTVAILLAASLLIATGTRGENALHLQSGRPGDHGLTSSPGIAVRRTASLPLAYAGRASIPRRQ
jgi:hypothetical protein